MDIKYAILGILNWKPYSGYDLKKIIAESELFYWSGNNNQIYNSLVQLSKDALVTQQVQHQESLPAKKIYSITPKGQEELRQWLLSEPELPEFRSSFLIQLACADALTDGEIEQLLSRYEEEISVQLRMRKVWASSPPLAADRTGRTTYLWKMISENMIAKYQHELEWVQQVRTTLREAPGQMKGGNLDGNAD